MFLFVFLIEPIRANHRVSIISELGSCKAFQQDHSLSKPPIQFRRVRGVLEFWVQAVLVRGLGRISLS